MKSRKVNEKTKAWRSLELELVKKSSSASSSMTKEFFGLGNDWWFPKILSLERKFLMRLMNLNFPSIPVATRCIKTQSKNFGGLTWKERLLDMWPNVTFAKEWRPNISSRPKLSNLSLFLLGSGRIYLQTLSPGYLVLFMGTIPFGSLWTDSLNHLISFQSRPPTPWGNMLSFTSPRLFVFNSSWSS